jgi:hypothetical protein
MRRFAVRSSPIHGRGVFALTRIAAGEPIIEYKGGSFRPRKLNADLSAQARSPGTRSSLAWMTAADRWGMRWEFGTMD